MKHRMALGWVALLAMTSVVGCADEPAEPEAPKAVTPEAKTPDRATVGGNGSTTQPPSTTVDPPVNPRSEIDCNKLIGSWLATIQPGSTADSILGKGAAVEGKMNLEITKSTANPEGITIKQALTLTAPLPTTLDLGSFEGKCEKAFEFKGVQQTALVGNVDFEVKLDLNLDTSPPSGTGSYKTAAKDIFTSTGTFKVEKTK